MNIERLTARNENGLAYLVTVKPNEQEVDSPHKNTLKCILDCFERLARYEEEAIARQSVKSDIGETSDGYHTFNELYEHRTALFATLCNMRSDISWKSMKHADGTMYEGMFIAGIETPEGQYTYHCEMKYWYMFAMTKEIDKAPAYDGHQPSDYPRLLALSENSPYRQSVKSEEVAEAIDAIRANWPDSRYTMLREALTLAITALQAYQPWISVDDRLPEKPQYDWVLVRIRLNPDGFYGLPHIAELRKGVWYSTEYDLPIEQILQGTVTHWKPLPEAPKGEGK